MIATPDWGRWCTLVNKLTLEISKKVRKWQRNIRSLPRGAQVLLANKEESGCLLMPAFATVHSVSG